MISIVNFIILSVSLPGLAGVLGYVIIPGISQLHGRKVGNIIVNTIVLFSSIIIGFATNVNTVLIGKMILGFSYCGSHLACSTIAEFSHPKRRDFFVILKLNIVYLGILICHCTMPVITWRQTTWLMAVPSVLGILVTLTWPESPSWLAYKSQYDECRKSFTWVRGKNSEAEKEVKELITAQMELKRLNSDYNNF